MTIAMMIDLETLSLRPDAYVVQVGYCVADLATGHYLTPALAAYMGEQGQGQRHTDIDTIRWWMQQDRAVASRVFSKSDYFIENTPDTLFREIDNVVRDYNVEEVWASPAMFDLPILTSLWDGKKPWVYNQERCLMTLSKIVDPDGALKPAPNMLHHDAAADAKWQMDYLIEVRRFMRNSSMQAVLPLETL